jgi:2'-5' RNA ligase
VTATPGEARVIGVAVAIPEPYASQLQGLRQRFGDPLAGSIPTHVTLLPPTTVDAALLPEIDAHLASVAQESTSFRMVLRGSGTFRPVSPVVFVGLAEGISHCERLENGVRSGVLWRPLHFNYHPHVTVAHDLPDAQLDEAAGELAGYAADFEIDHFTRYEHADGVWVPAREFAFAEPGPPGAEPTLRGVG